MVSHALTHDDPAVLTQAVAVLKEAYAKARGMEEVRDSLTPGMRRYDIRLTETGVAAGLTVADVAGQPRGAFFGAEVQRIQRGGDEVRVAVRYPGERRQHLGDLLDERIAVPAGLDVPLATVWFRGFVPSAGDVDSGGFGEGVAAGRAMTAGGRRPAAQGGALRSELDWPWRLACFYQLAARRWARSPEANWRA